ncbi:MAG: AraC family transcriptional regulator [Myxococcota bacterium]
MSINPKDYSRESPYRISGTVSRTVLGALEALGIESLTVCDRAGLSHAEMTDSRSRISGSDLVRLWHAAAELSDDPFLGLHAAEVASWPPKNLVAALALSGETLGAGLRKLERFAGLIADGQWHRIEDAGDEVHSLLPGLCARLPNHSEFLVTLIQRALDLCAAEPLTAEEVWFQHSSRGGEAEYGRIFRCPVRFGQKSCGMVFSKRTWNTPMSSWDPVWAQQIETCAVDAAALLAPPGIVDSVRSVAHRLLPTAKCDVETAARELGMSDRTLQRRLKEEGTTFREVVDESRLAIVERNEARGMPTELALQRAGFPDRRAYRRTLRRRRAYGRG